MKKSIHMKEFNETLNYPIYYLSINTTQKEHLFSKMEIPYQYSIHIEYSNRLFEHKEFFSETLNNSSYEFAKMICKDIPPDCTIFSDNMSRDIALLQTLAKKYYEFRYQLYIIIGNMQDVTKTCLSASAETKKIQELITSEDNNDDIYEQFQMNQDESLKVKMMQNLKLRTMSMIEALRLIRNG